METVQINDLMYDRGRGPELRRCRITVYDLVPYLLNGHFTDEEIVNDALPITAEELTVLKTYIAEHNDDVMAWHWKIEERNRKGIEAQDTPENREHWQQSRERMNQFQLFLQDEKRKGIVDASAWEQTQSKFHKWLENGFTKNGVHVP